MNKLVFATLLGLVLLIAAAALGVASFPASLSPETAQPVDVSPRLLPGLGVNVALQRYDEPGLVAALDAIDAAGFTWLRQRFPWDEIEPEPGQFAWPAWDAIVTGAAERDLALVAVLDGSPAWARRPTDSANNLAPPQQRADFGRFAGEFARRYGGQIHLYQVWDEPNIAPHWGARPVDAADYAGLLREAAIQLRAADADAAILLAALAPTIEPGSANQSDIAFLDAIYRAGGAAWFDAAAAQPYGFENAPGESPAPDRLNFRRAELLREVMRRHDDDDTALWLAAFGWHAGLDGRPAADSPWGSVDETAQAAWAVEAAGWARLNWPWLGGLAWASWQPAQPPGDPHWGFSLLAPDGRSRPALRALQDWLAQPQPLGPGAWPANHPALLFEGGWRSTTEAGDPPLGAASGNNRLVIPFEGTGLWLDMQRGPFWAYFDVAIDGQPANGLPRDGAGRANLVLYDPLAGREIVALAEDLPDGLHTAEVVANGGWEQWPLRQVIVVRDQAARWPGWLPWLLAGLGALLLIGAWPAPLKVLSRLLALLLVLPITLGMFLRTGWIRYAVLAALVAIAGLLSGLLQIAAIVLLLALFVAFCDLGPFLLAIVAPLFLLPVALLSRPLNPAELVAWLATAALLANLLLFQSTANEIIDVSQDESLRLPAPREFIGRLTPLDGGVLALLGLAALSLPFAGKFGLASHEFRTVIVTGVLAYGLIRLAPPFMAGGTFKPWLVFWGLGLGAAIVAAWGIYQALAGVDLISAEGVLRVRGLYGSPNNLSLYLGHVLPVLLAVAALAQSRKRRLTAALLALPVAAALLLTFSKGALLLGLPAAILFLGFAAGGRWRWLALAALAVGGLALLPLFRTERFAGLFDLQGGTSFLRLQLWQGAWNMIRDHPWPGVGLDNFLYAYRTTYVLPTAWQELNLSHPHNILLDFWTRLGIGGVLVGGWLFAAAFRPGWRALAGQPPDERALLLGLLASLIATLAHGLIDNSLFLMDLMILFMLTLGLIARLARETDGLNDRRVP